MQNVVVLALQRHYHPIVQRFAAHLIAGAPSEGSEALKPELSRRYLVVSTAFLSDYTLQSSALSYEKSAL